MKNLLIHINPKKNFDRETAILAKIQIDNSLDLGWKKDDIMIVTNFDYEYQGVRSIIVEDSNYCQFRPLSSKTVTVAYLLEKGLIGNNATYWVHDFDAYQTKKISDQELKLGSKVLGITDYGWQEKWCLGSYFVKEKARDVFQLIKATIYKYKLEDENALVMLTNNNINQINTKYKKLDIRYNFGMREIGHNYKIARKPLKVLHFHPFKRGKNVLNSFMFGENELGFPLMDKRLTKIFNKHLK